MKIDYKRIIKNSFYLLVVQGMNYLIPLFVMFYLLKKIGQEGYGEYAFLYSIIIYCQVIMDYGFLLTGSRDIVRSSGRKNRISEIFFDIYISKILLSITLGVFYFTTISLINVNLYLYTYVFIFALCNSFSPIWYFHGKENFRFIAISNTAGKIAWCLLIFFLVDSYSDLDFIFLSGIFTSFLTCSFSFIYIFKRKEIIKVKLSKKRIIYQLKKGRHIFSTTALSSVLSNGCVFWLGLNFDKEVVGRYAIVESLTKAVSSLLQPITKAVYPISAEKFKTSRAVALSFTQQVGKKILFIAFIASIFLILFSQNIIYFITQQETSFILIVILSTWMFFGVLNNIFGIQILTAMGKSSIYNKKFLISSIIFVATLIPFSYTYQAIGSATALLISEITLSMLLYFSIRKIDFSY